MQTHKQVSQISKKNQDMVLIWAFRVLVAPRPSYVLLMLGRLKPGYTYLLLQNMAGREGWGGWGAGRV